MADSHPTDRGVEWILRNAEELHLIRHRASRRMQRPRETMATLLLGTASVALAMVAVIVTFGGLFGISFTSWSDPRDVLVEVVGQSTTRWDVASKSFVSEPVFVSSGRIWVPSGDFFWLAWAGLVLSGIGLAVSLQRRKLSWLSAIGFVLTLLVMMTIVACDTLLNLR